MAVTNFSPLLGLALPTTGDLSGTWGTTVNDSITSLLDTAVAGTTTLSTDADVTLSTTNGAANQARSSVLLCSGARTALRTITAPAQSKAYIIINQTTGGFAVKIVGSGPTTGVTIANGEKALVAWNGSDFVLVSAIPIDLTTDVTGSLPLANGGTGGTSAATARTNLGATTLGSNLFTATNPSAITFIKVNADNTVSTESASTYRGSIGGTTLGSNLFTITNPSAVTFPRFNADNTVSALDAATFRTAIGAGTGGGSVTSVSGTGTVNGITLSGTVTSSGNLTLGGTLSGVSLTTQVTGTLPVANGGTGATDAATARANLGAGTGNGTVTSVTVSAGSGLSGGGTVTSSGTITLTNAGVTSVTGGTGISVSGSTGAVTISASGGGGNLQQTVFNSTGTFTVPTGVTKVYVEVTGGGGGSAINSSRGGGGGGYSAGILTVTPGTSITATVGAGGTGGQDYGFTGTAGGASSFSTMSANGGNGSGNNSGTGGTGSGGARFNITGTNGQYLVTVNNEGTPGSAGFFVTYGSTPRGPGSGGYSAGNSFGTNGTAGQVVVWYVGS